MSAQSDWQQAVRQKKSDNPRLSHAQAVSAVARENPELRQRFVAEVNATRKAR